LLIWVFLIFPYLVILGFTLARILKKTSLLSEVIYHTVFQSITSYLFVMLFLFQGFIDRFYVALIVIILLLVVGLFYFIKETEFSFAIDNVIKIEGIKNNILIVLVTVLPMYVVMTIFRYLPWYLQLFLSLVSVSIIFLLSVFISKAMEKFFQNLKDYFIELGSIKYVIIWLSIGIILFFGFFFQIPVNSLKKTLNLNNNAIYMSFDGLPVDIQNNYEQNQLVELKLGDNLSTRIRDFYLQDDYLYLNYENYIEVYSVSKSELIKKFTLEYSENETMEQNPFNKYFIFYDDNLYFFGYFGLYLLDEVSIEKISTHSYTNTRVFFDNDNTMNLVYGSGINIYEIYEVLDNQVNLVETIDLNLHTYQQLEVISETLFYRNDKDYYLFEDSSIKFENISGEKIYNKEMQLMYYYLNIKVYLNDQTETKTILSLTPNKIAFGGMVQSEIIFTDGNQLDKSRLLIFNKDMSEIQLFNHMDTDKFIKGNDYDYNYVSTYREIDDNITFMQLEIKEDETLLTLYNLIEEDVDIPLPFYTHYGIFIMIFILIGIFIPVTDDIKFVTYIDFSSVNRKND